MKTDHLIRILSTNLEPVKRGQLGKTLAGALVIAGLAAFCLMLAVVSVRPDVAGRAHLPFLAVELLFALGLVAAGAAFLGISMSPGRDGRKTFALIFLPFVAIFAAGLAALARADSSDWSSTLVGTEWAACLICIPLFAVMPFGALIWALRKAAPADLQRTGAIAGLVAGALGAAAYAFHCPDDSLPFIAIWFSVPIVLCAFIGATLGPRLLRW
ncbi:hypothetical protein SAMN05519103_07618 [Rhizobiales bacterium GAS113]|nr:hypothetical protein SAMN05519103_07618 [Rhizobiales bacterium GAS113]